MNDIFEGCSLEYERAARKELVKKIRDAALAEVEEAYDMATIEIDTIVREQINSHLGCNNLSDKDVLGIAIQASNLTRLLHRKAINNLRGESGE